VTKFNRSTGVFGAPLSQHRPRSRRRPQSWRWGALTNHRKRHGVGATRRGITPPESDTLTTPLRPDMCSAQRWGVGFLHPFSLPRHLCPHPPSRPRGARSSARARSRRPPPPRCPRSPGPPAPWFQGVYSHGFYSYWTKRRGQRGGPGSPLPCRQGPRPPFLPPLSFPHLPARVRPSDPDF